MEWSNEDAEANANESLRYEAILLFKLIFHFILQRNF